MFRAKCALCHSKYWLQSEDMHISELVDELFYEKMTFHCGNPNCWSYFCTGCLKRYVPSLKEGAITESDWDRLPGVELHTPGYWLSRFEGPYLCPVCGEEKVHATCMCYSHSWSKKKERKN